MKNENEIEANNSDKQQTSSHREERLVRLCEGGRGGCSRPGDLVIQDVMGPLEFERGKPACPWVFRWYLCPHHRGAWNRTRLDHCKKLTVVEYVDDEILLPNVEVKRGEPTA